MSTHTIKAGHHYDTAIFSTWLHVKQRVFTKTVAFAPSCAYELSAYHQTDVNKLFGAAYGFFGVHRNSARFGWRWSPTAQKIELLAYTYANGVKQWDEQLRFPVVAQIELNESVDCTITVTPTDFIFSVKKGDETLGQYITVAHGKLPAWGTTCSLYFGGELPAPHAMTVYLT